MDEYAAKLFGPDATTRSDEDGGDSEKAIVKDIMTRVEESMKRMSVNAPDWWVSCCSLLSSSSLSSPTPSVCVLRTLSHSILYFPSRIRTDKILEHRETHHAASAALSVLWPAVGSREDELELKEWVGVMQRCVFCGLHLSWLFCRYSFRLVDSFSCYSDTTN